MARRTTAQGGFMRIDYLGDSYDIVKQSLLRWLHPFGEWAVHPMFTEPFSPAQVSAYGSLLGANVLSAEVLTLVTSRATYFGSASSCGHLFMDPDTGLRVKPTRGVLAPKYLFASELSELSEHRPHSLTVVFDQSVGRGSEPSRRSHLEDKLRHLRALGIRGFAYISHACFVISSRDQNLVEHARARIIAESRLPESRFLSVAAAA
jgi:hypothetical protein